MADKRIAAVFGYVNSFRKALLDEIVVKVTAEEFEAVIASGGRTSRKNNPGVSEAAIIFAHLYKELMKKDYRLVPKFWIGEDFGPEDLEAIISVCGSYPLKGDEPLTEIDFYFEDRARTTRENVLFMKALLEQYGKWDDCRLVAYCNKAHRVKISALALCVWGYLPGAVTYDSGAGLSEYAKQLAVTLPTVLALKIKFLRTLEDRRREKQMNNN